MRLIQLLNNCLMLKWTTTFLSVLVVHLSWAGHEKILTSFSTSEMKLTITSLSDDETTSFSVVHLDLTGEVSERGGLFENGIVLLCK